MDSRRLVWTSILGIAISLATQAGFAAEKVEKAEKYQLKARHAPGEIARVEVSLEVGGDVKLLEDKGQKSLPMSVVASLKYDEAVSSLDTSGRLARTLRYYDDASAVIKIDKGGEKASLAPQRRYIAAERDGKTLPLLYAVSSPLKREELDLIEVPGSSLLVDSLLPTEMVALGQSWKLDDQSLSELLGLDAVSWTDVEAMLGEVKDSQAEVTAGGSVNGAIGGVSTEIELKAKYRFDLQRQQITNLALLIKEKRSIGHVGPGLDTVAKVLLSITPSQQSPHLTPAVLQKFRAVPRRPLVSYLSASGAFGFDHDRRWYLTSDDKKLAVFRYLDRGDLVAQCNVSTAAGGEKTPTLAEFQRDVQHSLGKNFGQFVHASHDTNSAGYRVFRVVAQGTVSQLPIEWIYYLVTNDKGQRVSLAFTFEQGLEDKFAAADRVLVNQLRLLDSPTPTAAKPLPSGAAKQR